jgi:hypothetical protein
LRRFTGLIRIFVNLGRVLTGAVEGRHHGERPLNRSI